MTTAKATLLYHNVISGNSEPGEIDVISEVPLSLTVNGELWLTFMCTPLDLEALAVGFLFNEEVIDSLNEIASIRVCSQGDNVDIWLEHHVDKPLTWNRTSGCTGGFTRMDHTRSNIQSDKKLRANGAVFDFQQITGLVDWLFEAQNLYRQAGGVHTSVLSDGRDILILAEDIGRHNTLDKIAGRCLLESIDSKNKLIITTGRVSSEMLYKSARIGATVLVSRTSPTTLSVDLAGEYGITLIGYARRDRFKVYSYPERILVNQVAVGNVKVDYE